MDASLCAVKFNRQNKVTVKQLTKRSVDYLWLSGHDFWEKTLSLKCMFWHFEYHKPGAILFYYIWKKADISADDISHKNNLDG